MDPRDLLRSKRRGWQRPFRSRQTRQASLPADPAPPPVVRSELHRVHTVRRTEQADLRLVACEQPHRHDTGPLIDFDL